MSLELSFNERRVLGVLIEKGLTTPEQYPLTLNALVNGSNQKSCRDPMAHLGEKEVLDTIDTLRAKGLVAVVRSTGGRTDRYRHRCTDTLSIEGREVAVLAELLLRGPQTDGELRQRASRMVEIPSLGDLAEVLDRLRTHEPPLMPPAPSDGRRRGVKYSHALYPADERPATADDGVATSGHAPPTRTTATPEPAEVAPAPTTTYGSAPLRSSPDTSAAVTNSSGDLPALQAELAATRKLLASLEKRVEELETTFIGFLK